jgi:hypothetical protein
MLTHCIFYNSIWKNGNYEPQEGGIYYLCNTTEIEQIELNQIKLNT